MIEYYNIRLVMVKVDKRFYGYHDTEIAKSTYVNFYEETKEIWDKIQKILEKDAIRVNE